MARFGGIELGGTKTIVVLGAGNRILERRRFPTTSPSETMGQVVDTLAQWHESEQLDGIGIASFGPVRVDPAAPDHGFVLTTSKPGWSGADVAGPVRSRFSCPIGLDTDVNAAALAEYHTGAARGCPSMVYLTIGTGVGGGLVIDGRPVHGRLHPEIGHVRLRRGAFAQFDGVCPFHGDCIEGLVSGPALAARFGCDPADVPADDPRWDAVCADLAELFAMLIFTLSPSRIVVGGGVIMGQPHILPRCAAILPGILAGYLPDYDKAAMRAVLVPPQNGNDAGPCGALLLAKLAAAGQEMNR